MYKFISQKYLNSGAYLEWPKGGKWWYPFWMAKDYSFVQIFVKMAGIASSIAIQILKFCVKFSSKTSKAAEPVHWKSDKLIKLF